MRVLKNQLLPIRAEAGTLVKLAINEVETRIRGSLPREADVGREDVLRNIVLDKRADSRFC